MRLSLTLSLYIGRQFLLHIGITLSLLVMLVWIVDSVELIKRTSGKEGATILLALEMALLKTPYMASRILPFAILIGSMSALTRLTKSHELIIARAAGVSVWQFLAPALMVVVSIALLFLAVMNPISAVSLLRFEKLEARYIAGQTSLLTLSNTGLWLRQQEKQQGSLKEYVIHAKRISQTDMTFKQVMILTYGPDDKFIERFDAAETSLRDGELILNDVVYSVPGKPAVPLSRHSIATNLQIEQIQDSFTSPETMPFWNLPGFIDTLEEAGFSALKHKIYWHSLLASPLLFVGMVLLAAVFSLRLPRRGKIALLVLAGGASGFALHFMTDLVHALGGAGSLPIWLAGWTPSLIIISLASAALLHTEDG